MLVGLKVERLRANHPHRLVDDFAVPHGDRCQLTGAIGAPVGCFKVNCREISSKIHDFHSRHQIGVRGSFSVVPGVIDIYPRELPEQRQFPNISRNSFSSRVSKRVTRV